MMPWDKAIRRARIDQKQPFPTTVRHSRIANGYSDMRGSHVCSFLGRSCGHSPRYSLELPKRRLARQPSLLGMGCRIKVGSDLALAIAALWQRDSRCTKPAEATYTFLSKFEQKITIISQGKAWNITYMTRVRINLRQEVYATNDALPGKAVGCGQRARKGSPRRPYGLCPFGVIFAGWDDPSPWP